MDFTVLILIVTGVFILGVFVVVSWMGGMTQRLFRGSGWDRAVAATADKLKLHHSPVKDSWDLASGSVAGVDVSLQVGQMSDDSFLSGIAMVLEVGASFDRTLTITRHGEAPRVHVPSQPRGWNHPTPSGLADLDAQLSICGGGQATLQGLHVHAELRHLLMHVVVTMGVQICAGHMKLKRRSIATDEAEIFELLGPLLDLAKWLSEPAAPHPQLSSKLRAGTHGIAASVSHAIQGPQREQAMWQLAQAIGQRVGHGEVTYDQSERATDWRGPVNGCPSRIRIDMGSDVVITLSMANHAARFALEYDTKAIPQVGTPPPWDDKQQVKVFVARGIYFFHQDEAEMASFRELPAQASDALCAAIQRDNIRWVYIQPTKLEIHYRHDVNDMADPLDEVSRGALLLGWLAQHLAAMSPSVALSSPPGQSLTLRVTCRYCSTAFLHGHRLECPNCGAPHQG